MKIFLPIAVFCGLLLTSNAKAEDKVWYCEMTGLAKITVANGAQTFKPETFKMKVGITEVTFGSGGYFGDSTMPITFWVNENYWRATDDVSVFSFKDGEVYYSSAISNLGVIGLAARCDDF